MCCRGMGPVTRHAVLTLPAAVQAGAALVKPRSGSGWSWRSTLIMQLIATPPPVSQAGSTFGWEKYVGSNGISIGVDTFGASAPGPVLYKQFGITTEAVVDAVNKLT